MNKPFEYDSCKGCKYEMFPSASIYCRGCTRNSIDKYTSKKFTNADRIRNMNNDELNDMLNSVGDGDLLCHYMGKEPSNSCSNPNQDACYLCVKKWLESEV